MKMCSPLRLGVVGSMLLCAVILTQFVGGSNPALRHLLGLDDALPTSLPSHLAIALSPRTSLFAPHVAVVPCGSHVTFTNGLDTPVAIHSAMLSPAPFALSLAAHTQATTRLTRPGLYHYYDALTAYPRHVVAGNAVIVTKTGRGSPRQGWIAVLCGLPSLRQELQVPQNHDLFAPKVLVGVVGSTITVSNHDADAHNFVVDPASPAGAAFVVNGTDDEPPHGWHRALVVQQPGIYHVYCTFHAQVVGKRDGWRVLVPRRDPTAYETSADYRDHNTMEAWIVVLPATATV